MRSVMKQMVSVLAASKDDSADTSATHLRNIDIQLKALTDETIKGQDKFASSLHSEIRLLARTLGAIVDGTATVPKSAPVRSAEPAKPAAAPAPKPAPKAPPGEDGNYKMPEVKPKANKKPALTAKRDD